jgi:hypothetical protein
MFPASMPWPMMTLAHTNTAIRSEIMQKKNYSKEKNGPNDLGGHVDVRIVLLSISKRFGESAETTYK